MLKRPDASSLGKHALKDVVVPEGHKRGDGVAEQRLSRKEIRQPDQFVSLSVQIAAWIKAHTVFLIYGIGVVAVAATLMTGWWAWQKHREQQADIALYEATKFMRTPSANRLKAVDPLQKLVSDYRGTAATDEDASQAAVRMVRELTQEAEIGQIYLGTVRKIMDFGAFIEIFPGTDGLLHISQISDKRVNKVTDEFQEGDQLLVKVLEVDRNGRIRLSHKEAIREREATKIS